MGKISQKGSIAIFKVNDEYIDFQSLIFQLFFLEKNVVLDRTSK